MTLILRSFMSVFLVFELILLLLKLLVSDIVLLISNSRHCSRISLKVFHVVRMFHIVCCLDLIKFIKELLSSLFVFLKLFRLS